MWYLPRRHSERKWCDRKAKKLTKMLQASFLNRTLNSTLSWLCQRKWENLRRQPKCFLRKLIARLASQEKAIKELTKRARNLEVADSSKELVHLQLDVNILEYHIRPIHVEIHGVQETEKGDLVTKVNEIGKQVKVLPPKQKWRRSYSQASHWTRKDASYHSSFHVPRTAWLLARKQKRTRAGKSKHLHLWKFDPTHTCPFVESQRMAI